MSSRESLYFLMGMNLENLSKEEILLLEAELLLRIHKELIEFFKKGHEEFFRSMKFTTEMEKNMLETNFINLIVRDILSTEEYTLDGIAYQTRIHEDVLRELASGLNTNPSAESLLKIIELHISIRKELYDSIKKKIAMELLTIV
jgi:hypothetical protein